MKPHEFALNKDPRARHQTEFMRLLAVKTLFTK